MTRIINAMELRANPGLVAELRDGTPGDALERRTVTMTRAEMRANDDGSWRGGGLAAVFDSRSGNLGGFVEVIKPGAFRKVLKQQPDTRALINHDPNLVLGRTLAGTLRLKETPKGLDYEFDAPDTSYARDLRVLLERGDIDQSSFAFTVQRDGQEWDEDAETGVLVRTIHEFSGLFDVSPVTYPAYPDATSGVRSDLLDLAVLGLEDKDLDELRELAWNIHRGVTPAEDETRQALDVVLGNHSTVSPWAAERTVRAMLAEPDLMAAIPGKRANVELVDVEGEPDPRLAAMRRRLQHRARLL